MKFLSCLSSPNPIPPLQSQTQSRPLLADNEDEEDYDGGKPIKRGCIFCGVSSQNGFKVVYEDQELIAFRDRSPQAEQHLLIIPRYHLASTVRDLTPEHIPLLNRMLSLATTLHASSTSSLRSPSRLNTGFHIPPFSSVHHLHLHVLSGKPTLLGRIIHPFFSSGTTSAKDTQTQTWTGNGTGIEEKDKERLGWGWYISGNQVVRILERGGRVGLGPGGRRGIERRGPA